MINKCRDFNDNEGGCHLRVQIRKMMEDGDEALMEG